MSKELEEAVEKARKLEIDGADFYAKAAEKCSVPSGKRMFESFAGDERRHLQMIGDLLDGLGVEFDKMPMPRDEIQTVFAAAEEKIGGDVTVTADEKEAIRVAMGMETESYRHYKKAAEDASDELVRDLFERLALEENQHYEMLENTLEYLDSNQQWFLWNEGALIVGDQSTLGIE